MYRGMLPDTLDVQVCLCVYTSTRMTLLTLCAG